MRSAALVSVLLAGLSRAFVVPENLEDGIWAFELDAAGNMEGTPAAVRDVAFPAEAREALAASLLAARRQNPPPLPNPLLRCMGGYVNGGDFAGARQAFNSMCDSAQMYPANVGIVVAQGSALAYMCNYGSSNRCWRQEYEEANIIMDSGCGSSRVATVQVQRWSKSYGRGNRGENIC